MKTKLMALEALKLALPHINPKAIDGMRVEAEPIADCYVNTIVSATIAAIEADIAKPSEPVGAESRFTESSAWLRCSVEHHYLVSAKPDEWPGYETRLLYTTPQEPAPAGWQTMETAPEEGTEAIVSWIEDGEPQYLFELFEEGGWACHANNYDHYCMVASAGMTGPKETPPYTHWMIRPAAPGGSA